MALATYSDLKTSIAGWLYRDDLTSIIPDFITLAETWLKRDLRLLEMETASSSTLSGATVSIPSGMVELREVQITVSGKLITLPYRSPGDVAQFTLSSDVPECYTIQNSVITFFPTPASAYAYTIRYYAFPTALSDSNTTNWLLTLAPDAYLFGALLQATPYLKNDVRIPTWQAAYQRAIDTLNSMDKRKRHATGKVLQTLSDSAL